MYGNGKVLPASTTKHANMENSSEQWPYYPIFVEFCTTTTAHGFTWCLRLKSKVARRTLLTILFFFVLTSTLTLVFNFWAFMSASTVTDNVAFITAKKIKYPNITVCSRKYFSKRLLNEFNISNDLANYMTMVFDPSAAFIYSKMPKSFPLYSERLRFLQDQLHQTMSLHNKTFTELLDSVAVRCNEMIPWCSLHHQGSNNCCEISEKGFFDPRPFFTIFGTCFARSTPVGETRAHSMNYLRLLLHQPKNDVPEFKVLYKDASVTDMNGFIFAVGNLDHPVAAVGNNPHAANLNQTTIAKLKLTAEDRSKLSRDQCDSGEDFEAMHNLPYTAHNCKLIQLLNGADNFNCSLLKTSKIATEGIACLPSDAIKLPINCELKNLSGKFELERTRDAECKPACLMHEYEMATETMPLNKKEPTFPEPGEYASIKFYFTSLDYVLHQHTQPGIEDFVSTQGGMWGLLFGSSCVSFYEIVYLLYRVARTFVGRCGNKNYGENKNSVVVCPM